MPEPVTRLTRARAHTHTHKGLHTVRI